MPTIEPAASVPPLSHPSAALMARRSLRRSLERRAAAARARIRRRGARAGSVAVLGAMTLAAGAATAQDPVGGVSPKAQAASSTLRPGDTGRAVTALQKALGIPSDGAYGAQTRRAVRRLQRKRHMKVDGVARPSVLRALGVDAQASAAEPRVHPVLQRIARCESGGNPRAVSAGGRYRGKYQFSLSTWRHMGGEGDPAAAPEAQQDRVAAELFAAQGRAPWPHCGPRA